MCSFNASAESSPGGQYAQTGDEYLAQSGYVTVRPDKIEDNNALLLGVRNSVGDLICSGIEGRLLRTGRESDGERE